MATNQLRLATSHPLNAQGAGSEPVRAKAKGDKRQQSMLLPVKGGGQTTPIVAEEKPSRRKKASQAPTSGRDEITH
jgi:hypothetical protein